MYIHHMNLPLRSVLFLLNLATFNWCFMKHKMIIRNTKSNEATIITTNTPTIIVTRVLVLTVLSLATIVVTDFAVVSIVVIDDIMLALSAWDFVKVLKIDLCVIIIDVLDIIVAVMSEIESYNKEVLVGERLIVGATNVFSPLVAWELDGNKPLLTET